MNKQQRIQAVLRGDIVDRPPLTLWQHYHREDRTPVGLATPTLSLANEYDLDLVKLTPSGLYAVEDWAANQIFYPGSDHDPPFLSTPVVAKPAEWRRLAALDPARGALGRELEAIRLVAAGLGGETPLVMTIFSPLTLAFKLAGEAVIAHLREHPLDLHAGLETMGLITARFARAALDAGADGLFFATQLASHHWLTPAEYEEFGQRYDMQVLEAIGGQSAITVLHLHGQNVFFDLANRYPIHAVSWHDQETAPSLAEARRLTGRAFITGLDRILLGRGPIAAIEAAQVHEALTQTGGQGLILAPSCVIPTTAQPTYLRAAGRAISEWVQRTW
jgi:uroporphyrinogen decarboxylase